MAHLVLLVEDDPDARYIYRASLQHARLDVLEAGSVREALSATSPRRPDIVVLDRRLPDRDGLDLAKQWRMAVSSMSRVPIILLTAHAARPDVEAALAAGCDAFLAKPCPGDILVAHVTKLLVASTPTRRLPRARGPG